jgi:hypothetical protein
MNAEYIGEKSIVTVGLVHVTDDAVLPTLPSLPKPKLDAVFDELHAAMPAPAVTKAAAIPRATIVVERDREFIEVTAFVD